MASKYGFRSNHSRSWPASLSVRLKSLRERNAAVCWPADTFVDFDHGLNAAVKRATPSVIPPKTPFYRKPSRARLSVALAPSTGLPAKLPLPFHEAAAPAESPRNCLSSCRRRHGRLACWTSFVRCGSLHGTPLDRQPGKHDPVFSAAISPDGKSLAFTGKTNLSPRGGHWRNSSRHHSGGGIPIL